MRLSRRPTRSLVHWLSLALLFMQMATAAYACPAWAADPIAPAAPAAMAEMPGCAGEMRGALDPDQPQLCQAHCQQGSQTVQVASTWDASASPVLLAVLDWTANALQPAQPVGHAREFTAGASPRGSPPRYLALLVLRN